MPVYFKKEHNKANRSCKPTLTCLCHSKLQMLMSHWSFSPWPHLGCQSSDCSTSHRPPHHSTDFSTKFFSLHYHILFRCHLEVCMHTQAAMFAYVCTSHKCLDVQLNIYLFITFIPIISCQFISILTNKSQFKTY